MGKTSLTVTTRLAENYHPTLHFPSAVAQRVLASFHSWLWFESPQLLCFDSLSMLSSALFLHLSKQLFAINLKCGCSSVMCLQLISAAPVWPKNLWIQVLNKLMCGHRWQSQYNGECWPVLHMNVCPKFAKVSHHKLLVILNQKRLQQQNSLRILNWAGVSFIAYNISFVKERMSCLLCQQWIQ